MTVTEFLKAKERKEHISFSTGKPTGEYSITIAEIEEYAELKAKEAAWKAWCIGSGRTFIPKEYEPRFIEWYEQYKQ